MGSNQQVTGKRTNKNWDLSDLSSKNGDVLAYACQNASGLGPIYVTHENVYDWVISYGYCQLAMPGMKTRSGVGTLLSQSEDITSKNGNTVKKRSGYFWLEIFVLCAQNSKFSFQNCSKIQEFCCLQPFNLRQHAGWPLISYTQSHNFISQSNCR